MKGNRGKDIFRFLIVVAIIVLVNIISSLRFFRIDLTSEGRYTLSDATKELLTGFDDILLLRVYLEGDFPAGFKRLQRETQQMLDEFRAYNPKLEYEFIDPSADEDPKLNQQLYQQLQSKGLKNFQLQVTEKGGNKVQNIFPGALMSYGDQEIPIQLLLDQFATSPDAQVNNSVQNLEYALANGIRVLTKSNKPLVGFMQGHEELDPRYIVDLAKSLSENYTVNKFDIRKFKIDSASGKGPSIASQLSAINRFNALIIAKPKKAFNNLDKYLIDQYIMSGGKVVWLIDAVHAEMDSLSNSSQFLSFPTYDQLRIQDMLFTYGVRINTNLVQDMVCAGVSDQKSINPWIYFPLVMPQVSHPISKNLNAIKLDFASTLDTISVPGIEKTFLLKTSPYAYTAATPHVVNLAKLYNPPPEARFTQKNLPLAVLLEGTFTSAFKNRITPKENSGENLPFRQKSVETQMLVVGDGDIAKNQLNILNPNLPKGTPLPLGYDQFTRAQYGNKEFLLNALDYFLDESSLISLRSRELKIRLLDANKVRASKLTWQLINTLVPIALIVLFGVAFTTVRRMKFGK